MPPGRISDRDAALDRFARLDPRLHELNHVLVGLGSEAKGLCPIEVLTDQVRPLGIMSIGGHKLRNQGDGRRAGPVGARSEERRVGKEGVGTCYSGWWADH